jgi:hypothetical protein
MSRRLITSFAVLVVALGTGLGAYASTGSHKAPARAGTLPTTAHQYMASLQQQIPLPEVASPARLAYVIGRLNGRFNLPNTQAKLSCSYVTATGTSGHLCTITVSF